MKPAVSTRMRIPTRLLPLLMLATLAAAATGRTTVAGDADGETTRTAARRDNAKLQDITFDDVKFDMKKGGEFKRSMLTKKIEALDGKRIKIRGYMLPSFQQRGIKQFVLVRDNMECCFGPGAALYDCVLVEMKVGPGVEYSVRPITVEGIFSIKRFDDPDGNPLAIYRMDGLAVQ